MSRSALFLRVMAGSMAMLMGLVLWAALQKSDPTLAIRPLSQGLSAPDGFSVLHHLDANGINFTSITPQEDALLITFDSSEQITAAKAVLDRALPQGYIIVQQEGQRQSAIWLSRLRNSAHRFG